MIDDAVVADFETAVSSAIDDGWLILEGCFAVNGGTLYQAMATAGQDLASAPGPATSAAVSKLNL